MNQLKAEQLQTSSVRNNSSLVTFENRNEKSINCFLANPIDTSRPRLLTLDGDNNGTIKGKLASNSDTLLGILTHYQGEQNSIKTKGIVRDDALIGNVGDDVYCSSDGFLTTENNDLRIGKIVNTTPTMVLFDVGEEPFVRLDGLKLDSKDIELAFKTMLLHQIRPNTINSLSTPLKGYRLQVRNEVIIGFSQSSFAHSLDYGQTWSYNATGFDLRCELLIGDFYFVGGDSYAFKKSDNGYSGYTDVLTLPAQIYTGPNKNFLFMCKNQETFLLIAKENASNNYYVCASYDEGLTWEYLNGAQALTFSASSVQINKNNRMVLTTYSIPDVKTFIWSSQIDALLVQDVLEISGGIAGSQYGANVTCIVAKNGQVYTLNDEATEWINSASLGTTIVNLKFVESLQTFIATADNLSIYLSQDGFKWIQYNIQLGANPQYFYAIDDSRGNILLSHALNADTNQTVYAIKKL